MNTTHKPLPDLIRADYALVNKKKTFLIIDHVYIMDWYTHSTYTQNNKKGIWEALAYETRILMIYKSLGLL